MWYPLCSSDDRVDSALAKELEAAVKAEPASTPPTAMEAGAAALAAAGGSEVSRRVLRVRGLWGRTDGTGRNGALQSEGVRDYGAPALRT